jgi:multicomponent Na+:H+ antiporter subunit A
MLIGAAFALAQTDLKRLLAFSTISQLGHILTALGLGTSLGAAAGLFYCASHGLFKATLFLCAGAVEQAAGTRDLRRLGGLASRMPRTAAAWVAAAAAIVGVPLCNGFVAKWLLLVAALEAGQASVVGAAWLASALTTVYALKATATVFYGSLPEPLRRQEVADPPATMVAGMWCLAAGCLVFGVAPQLLMDWVVLPATRALGFAPGVQLAWFGLQAGASDLMVTAGGGILLAAVLAGVAGVVLARPLQSDGAAVFTGGDPLPAGGVTGPDFSEVAEAALAPLYRVADPDPVYRSAWRAVDRLAATAGRAWNGLEARPLLAPLVLVALVLAAAWLA